MQAKPSLGGDNGQENMEDVELGNGTAGVSGFAAFMLSPPFTLTPRREDPGGDCRDLGPFPAGAGGGRGKMPGWQHPQPGPW